MIANGQMVDLFFHDIKPDQVDAFNTFIAMLAPYRANIRTYAELFPEK